MGSIRRSIRAALDLFVFSVPITVSLFAELLTAVTDTFLAGHLGGQSAHALAAMSFAAPVIGLFAAVQSLFALPIGVVVARCIDDRERRDARFFFATTACAGVSGLLSVVFVANIGWLLPALGAQGEELAMLEGYLAVQAVSNVVSAVGFSLATGIRALGHPIAETVITTVSVVADIALNVVFAFGLDFDFMGLAYGTLASEVICAAVCAVWLARARLLPAPCMLHGKEASECLREIVEIGVAQGAPQFVSGVAMVFSNAAMASMGADQVAAWGVAQRFYMLAITPMVGMSSAAQTLLALREGEGDMEGARSAARVAICLSATLGAVTGLLSICGAGAAATAFGAVGSLGEMAKEGLVISCAALPFVGVSQAVGAVLIVRGFPRYVVAACLCRNAAFAILALFFSAFPGAAYGFVALSAPISDCIAAVVLVAIERRIGGSGPSGRLRRFILPSELFCNILKRVDKDGMRLEGDGKDLNELLIQVFKNIEGSAVGTNSEADIKGLFDDMDVNSAKLGNTVIERNKKLVNLMAKIGSLDFGGAFQDNSIDAFGDACKFLMTMYASNAGKSGGEFFTPEEVGELLARIAIDGRESVNKVYDPCCGSGGLLLKFSKILGKENVRGGYFGQEINLTTYNLARINMFLHDINFTQFDIALGDTLKDP